MPKKENVRQMFDSIAPEYDRLNHLMSMNVDKGWRRKALRRIVDSAGPLEVLDLACGTGDFSLAIARRMEKKGIAGHVSGVDLSEGMLAVMKEKIVAAGLSERISTALGDGENLPFADGSFDRVTIAFGIRNFEHREAGLREMLRVLRPGGRLVLLELSVPENRIVRRLYNLYFLHILPLIGGKVSGDRAAYNYLPASVVKFPGRTAFLQTLGECGFRSVTHKAFTLGICRMYTGEKPVL